MVVNEQRRRLLDRHVADTLGAEAADMLLDELPPLAWADIATKQDLAILRAEMRASFAEIKVEQSAQTRNLIFSMLAMWIATIGALGAILTATGH